MVIVDAFLSKEAQVTAAAQSAFCHPRMIRQLVPYLMSCDLVTVILAMVSFRLYYCNNLYMELLLSLLQELQLMQDLGSRMAMAIFLQTRI